MPDESDTARSRNSPPDYSSASCGNQESLTPRLPVVLQTAILSNVVITEADVAAIITSVARSAGLPPGRILGSRFVWVGRRKAVAAE
jgi:hypothetical protein